MTRGLLALTVAIVAVVGCGGQAEPRADCLVKVYFERSATQEQIDSVRGTLEVDERVNGIELVTKEEALEIMRERLPELVQNLTGNPLPDSLDVTVGSESDGSAIAADLDPVPRGVETVRLNCGDERRVVELPLP